MTRDEAVRRLARWAAPRPFLDVFSEEAAAARVVLNALAEQRELVAELRADIEKLAAEKAAEYGRGFSNGFTAGSLAATPVKPLSMPPTTEPHYPYQWTVTAPICQERID